MMPLEPIAPTDRHKPLGVRMKGLIQIILAGVITVILSGVPPAQAQTYNLIPQPAELAPGSGRLVIGGSFRVELDGYQEPRLEAAAARLTRRLSQQTVIPRSDVLGKDPSKAALVIPCDHAGEKVQSVKEDEFYQLEVTPQQARLTAPTPVGVLRGIETFLQLVDLNAQGFGAPAVHIADRPRFPWRGLLLDPARHWMTEDVVKRNIDAMAAVKLNLLHLHLYYGREHPRIHTSLTPYNRLVDAARPESEKARIFAGMVDHLSAHQDAVRKQLITWRNSHEALLPLLRQSALLEDDIPLAEDLSAVAHAGLEALDYLDSGHPAPQNWVQEQFVLLDLAAKPRAELLLMIVPPVRKLVEATQKGSR